MRGVKKMVDVFEETKKGRFPADLDEVLGAKLVDKWVSADGYLVLEFKKGRKLYSMWVE